MLSKSFFFVVLLLFAALLAGEPAVLAQTPAPVPAVADAPVFFELFAAAYSDSANLDLLHDNKVRLAPLGVESIREFDWKNHDRDDLSWWMRIEDLKYLLPVIDRGNGNDIRFVREWFDRWYEAHEQDPRPNPGAWQPMSAGIRALVLVRLLKDLHVSGRENAALELRLRESILEHQEFLERDENFEKRSNHGMWEALGLFETARVTGETGMAIFALRRLADVVKISVSDRGVHKEHSAAYHFYFSRWLSEFVEYFAKLGMDSWSDVELLTVTSGEMRKASYYLLDHEGNVPQIGDTDAQRVAADSLGVSKYEYDTVLFDEAAGIAVYKDPEEARLGRYIFFNTRQLRNLTLSLAHTHRDMLAVYFACNGEVVLGDGGRFEYRESIERRFFRSSAAHNTIIPAEHFDSTDRMAGPIGGAAPALTTDAGSVVFEGNLNNQLAIRRITIPLNASEFVVEDLISPDFDVVVLWNMGRDVVDMSTGAVIENDGESVHTWVLTTARGNRFGLELTVPAVTDGGVCRVEVVRGERDPMVGWYSSGYRQIEPVEVIKLRFRSPGGAVIRTRVSKH